MGHRVAAGKRMAENVWIGETCLGEGHPGSAQDLSRPGALIHSPRNSDNLVAFLRQRHREMTTDESGASGNRDSHRLPLMAKQISGDDLALDLGRAFVDPGSPDLAV